MHGGHARGERHVSQDGGDRNRADEEQKHRDRQNKTAYGGSSFHLVIPFIAAGIFYYLFNLLVEVVMGKIEKSMSYYS